MHNISKIILFFAVLVILPFSKAGYDALAQVAKEKIGDTPKISKPSWVEASIGHALDNNIETEKYFYNESALREFYSKRNHQPVWLVGYGNYQPKAIILLEVLTNSWSHGLNPEHYHISEITKLMQQPFGANRLRLELLLSDAVIRYGRDLTGMRVHPDTVRQQSKYWRKPLNELKILDDVAKNENLRVALRKLEPQNSFYLQLREELIKISSVSKPSYEEILPIELGGILRPGDGHKKIALIRQRMEVEQAPSGRYYYDDILAKEIMSFQREHGLEPDAVIGTKTLRLLNQTQKDKAHQIIANLERLRWLEQQKPEKYVLVNIPSATLWAVENNEIKYQMPVIVGKSARPTNSFKTEITGIRFNPDWTVPPTIKKTDFWPKLKQDPHYLTSLGIEMIQGRGNNAETIDPETIDWQSISWRDLNKIRMVQGPGKNNPLGQIRVIMRNPYNIYLHDTNKPDYFKRNDRTLSSGCIRVSEPKKLASFILGDNPEWSYQKMENVIESSKLTEIQSLKAIPVYILYQTIWQNDQGELVFGSDIYGQDKRLVSALKEMEGFVIEEQNLSGQEIASNKPLE